MEKRSIFKIVNGLTSALLIAPIISSGSLAMAQEVENEVEEPNTIEIYHNDFASPENIQNDPAIQDAGSTLTHASDLDFEGNENSAGVWVTDRGNDWSGIDVRFSSLELEVGQEYSISILGYLDSEEFIPEGAQLTLQTPDTYGWIDGTSELEAGEPFVLEGEYTHTDEVDEDENLPVAFRVQSNEQGKDIEFAVANILITTEESGEIDPGDSDEEAGPANPGEESDDESDDESVNEDSNKESELDILYHATFEEDSEGTVGAGVTVTHDNGAMQVTNRSENWHGLDIPFAVSGMEFGYTYDITIRGNVDDGVDVPEEAQAWLQVPEEDYPLLAEANFASGEEFILTDTFTLSNEAYTRLRVQSNEAGAGVDFTITEVLIEWDPNQTPIEAEEPDPDAPPAEEFTFIDFESEELSGFEGRYGEEHLIITDEENHTPNGQYSLHISNRQNNWHGPSLEVTPYINVGETYEVSAWVKVDTDSPQTLTLSTQVGDGSSAAYNNISSATLSAADGWVEILGEYRYTSLGGGFVSIYVESNNVNLDFYIDDVNFVEVESEPIDVDLSLTPIKDVYADYFRIGNAVSMPDLEGPRLDLLTHHHSLVTAENAMKPGEVYDGREFDFSGSNLLAETVKAEGLDLHGHVLVWHSQSPEWHHTENGEALSREAALENMQMHIETVMENFGPLGSWDVVNEALAGSWDNPENWRANLRNTGWLRAIGEDYIYQAFRIAREFADEKGWNDMVLYYNDYNDHVQGKARTMYHMIKDINEQWTAETGDTRKLISGVGMQGHYSISDNPENVKQSIERFEQLGIEIGITELDVTTSTENEFLEEENIRQAQFYARLFQIFREHSDSIDRVTFWGLNDANSWRSERFPLIFDGSLRAKLAYDAVVDPDGFLEEYPIGDAEVNHSYSVFGTPEINAEIDDIWSEAPVLNMNRMQSAHNINASGTARTLWDNENLYVLFQVTDSQLDATASEAHEQDSVEAFVNETGESTSSYIDGVGQYRVNYLNQSSFNPERYSEGFQSEARETDSGYIVEMAIPWKYITPEVGHTIGFDVQVNDAIDGERHGVGAWNDTTGSGWQDPSIFGELTLLMSLDDVEPVVIEEGIQTPILPGQVAIIADGSTSVRMPADLPEGTEIIVDYLDETDLPELDVAGNYTLVIAGEVVRVTMVYPEGEEDFSGNFELTLGINADFVGEEVFIYYYNEETGLWEQRAAEVEGQTITSTVTHFSIYGVFAQVEEEQPGESDGEDETEEPEQPEQSEDDSSEESEAHNAEDAEDQEEVTEVEEETSERLPQTATVTWTVGLIGLMGLLTGSGIHFIRKRK
ncbi:hypothetical protein GCM10008932_00160 [Alkalibacterium iburiense]|uniref:Beta-xylanase n=1 Tax=Alkalibacterium iburiense TaxID=290589 RepID=A0ABN0WZ01_9LACT